MDWSVFFYLYLGHYWLIDDKIVLLFVVDCHGATECHGCATECHVQCNGMPPCSNLAAATCWRTWKDVDNFQTTKSGATLSLAVYYLLIQQFLCVFHLHRVC